MLVIYNKEKLITELRTFPLESTSPNIFHPDQDFKVLSKGLNKIKLEETTTGDLKVPDNFKELVREIELEGLSSELRDERNSLLAELDKLISNPIRYNELPEEHKSLVTKYRKDLLDLPQQEGFPEEVEFPTKPAFI